MKTKILHLIFIAFIFPVGEAGAVFLLITPGASAAATGEAQVAKADDAYASYYNPAGLGFQRTAGAAAMHVNWLPNLADDLAYEFLAYKTPLAFGTLGGHLIFLNLGEQMATDENGDELGTFRSYMWALTTGYGVKLTNSSSVGFNFKVFHQKLADSGTAAEGGDPYSTDFAFDIGYLKKFGDSESPFKIGFNIANIGPKIDFADQAQADPSPTNLKIGISKEFKINDYNRVNLMFDINRLMVAKYAAMDRNGDGIIATGTKEEGYSDPWYKAIITCWLDDWYYQYDRDYDGDRQIGGYEGVYGEYRAFSGGNTYTNNGGYFSFGQDPEWRNQTALYDNGSNMTSLDYLDIGDTFNEMYDINGDGMWTPAEPFFDVGDGYYEEFDAESYGLIYGDNGDQLTSYQHLCGNDAVGYDGNCWIYYNGITSGAMFNVLRAPEMAEIEVDQNEDGVIDDADLVDGVYEYTWEIIYGQDLETGEEYVVWSDDIISIDIGDNFYNSDEEDHVDWDGDEVRDGAESYIDENGNGSYNKAYSPYNSNSTSRKKEVGSANDYSFEDELKEIIANFGLEYWYTDNFVVRGGYIYDKEGNIMNPTFGAGIKFDRYGFDFGYTAGKKDHARANTMFFSMTMDL